MYYNNSEFFNKHVYNLAAILNVLTTTLITSEKRYFTFFHYARSRVEYSRLLPRKENRFFPTTTRLIFSSRTLPLQSQKHCTRCTHDGSGGDDGISYTTTRYGCYCQMIESVLAVSVSPDCNMSASVESRVSSQQQPASETIHNRINNRQL